MEYKMFKMKGKLDLAKQKVSRLFRGLGNENADASDPLLSVALNEPPKSFAYHSLGAELEKSKALMYSRMMERPR